MLTFLPGPPCFVALVPGRKMPWWLNEHRGQVIRTRKKIEAVQISSQFLVNIASRNVTQKKSAISASCVRHFNPSLCLETGSTARIG